MGAPSPDAVAHFEVKRDASILTKREEDRIPVGLIRDLGDLLRGAPMGHSCVTRGRFRARRCPNRDVFVGLPCSTEPREQYAPVRERQKRRRVALGEGPHVTEYMLDIESGWGGPVHVWRNHFSV